MVYIQLQCRFFVVRVLQILVLLAVIVTAIISHVLAISALTLLFWRQGRLSACKIILL